MTEKIKSLLNSKALAQELNLTKEQTWILGRHFTTLEMEIRKLRTEANKVPELEKKLLHLEQMLLQESELAWKDTSAFWEMKNQIQTLEHELKAVVAFTKLLDMKDMPTPQICSSQLKLLDVRDEKINHPFPGRYTGSFAQKVPHGLGRIITTEPSIARNAKTSDQFYETWDSQFYLGRPIGRVIGTDSIGNKVQFLQLEGQHQGYEIASFSDGASAYVCADMNKTGVCVQIGPNGKAEPIHPYGDLQTGIRITIQRLDRTGSFPFSPFGNIVLDEIEGGKPKTTWRYHLEIPVHLRHEIPKPKFDFRNGMQSYLFMDQLRASAKEEILSLNAAKKSIQ